MMDRRSFIKRAGKMMAAAGATPLLPRLLAAPAFAQPTGGYKAMVCLVLNGGNDGNNMLVPADKYYADYATGRGSLALSRASLNSMSAASSGRLFGSHPALTNVAALHNAGHLAWLANAGPLTMPITKQSLVQGAITPHDLFAHPPQLAEWQSANTRTTSTTGWAGRIADLMTTQQSSKVPMVISTAGVSLLGTGANTSAASISSGGSSANVMNALQSLLPAIGQMETGDQPNHLQAEISAIQRSILNTTGLLSDAYQAGASIKTVFPATSIGQQLQSIAYLINARAQLTATTQIFFCEDLNYDTHSLQSDTHAANLAGVDAAVGSFVGAMQEIGMFNQVTLFTMSDFGRSLQPNSTAGTDHAWGNHHMIVGGAVKGGDVYGTFPSLDLGGDDDAGTTGLWIPSTSGTQYAATLAKWLGVSASDSLSIFPELGNFPTTTLSFI